MNRNQIEELLYQALETELGGVEVYRAAVACAVNKDLRKEWVKYGSQTKDHVRIVTGVFQELGLDPEKQTVGRRIVHAKRQGLVAAMEKALKEGTPEAAQLVAAECVIDAETKDHSNWELIGEVAKKADGETKKALKAAYDKVEDEEDEHLYHTTGWCRELWLDSLGLQAVLPPPEEEKDVKTAMGEARVKEQRKGKEKPASRKSKPARKSGKVKKPGKARKAPKKK